MDEKEAKFYRDKHVLEVGKNEFPNRESAIIIGGVSPENYDIINKIKKEGQIKFEFISLISGRDKKWAEATEILCDYVKSKKNIYTTRDDIKSEMWVYRDGIYIPQGKSELKEMLRNLLEEWYSTYIYSLVLAKIEADTFIDSKEFFSKEYPNEIPLSNGLLNLKTRELSHFTPSKIFFNKLPVNYNPSAECPKIEKFLGEVLPNEEDKKVFYELGGFCLLKEYKFEKAFMLTGDGRNGKDKTEELIKRLLGIENCASIPIASLDPNSFVIHELHNKMVNLAGEISSSDLKDTSMFKALTGRSLISAKRKYLRDINFVNYAKMVFACNELPMVFDVSRGFWDRWIVLEFPYTFVSQAEYESNKAKNSKLKVRDEDIIEKITTPEEMSGLLNKFLDALDELLINRNFSQTKSTEEVKTFWIRKSNSAMAFCMDQLEEDPEGIIVKKEFRKKYSEYCKKHKITTKSDLVIRRIMQDVFGASEERKIIKVLGSSYGEQEHVWVGVRWK